MPPELKNGRSQGPSSNIPQVPCFDLPASTIALRQIQLTMGAT